MYFVNGTIPPANPVDPPSAPGSVTAVHDGSGNVDLNWIDYADNELGFRIKRDGLVVASIGSDTTVYRDEGLAAGAYAYVIQAHNAGGSADSDPVAVDVVLPTRVFAVGESTVLGVVDSGSYLNTVQTDDAEILREERSSGRPSQRVSQLEHVWQVDNVGGGTGILLGVEANAPDNNEQEDFRFSYSLDGGTNYSPAFTLPAGSGGLFRTALPAGTTGTVLVKVVDTDRMQGKVTTDSLEIRRLYVESSVGGTPENVAPSAAFSFAVSGLTSVFTDESFDTDGTVVTWSWEFGDNNTTTQQHPTHTYANAGTYTVVLTVADDDGVIATASEDVTVSGASGGNLTLGVNAYKVKGVQTVDLVWSGATSSHVDIFRDDTLVATTANDGAYTDNIGKKGGGSYTYRVCESDSGICSDPVTVSF